MTAEALKQKTPGNEKIRILFVEDNPDDLELCLRELRKARLNISFEVVQTADAFAEKLLASAWDVVIADYQLGGWTGIDALKLMQERAKDTPFILVTGALGEELAVDCIKQGVSDYVLKDRLKRLPVAVRQVMQQVQLKKQRNQANADSRESDLLFRTLAESIDSAILVYVGPRCRYVNHQAEVITGYSRDELLAMNSLSLIAPESRDSVIRMGSRIPGAENPSRRCEVKITSKSGEARWLDMTSSVIEVEGKRGRLVTAFDITGHKSEKEEMRRLATIDSLTGLMNYRGLTNAFDAELARWKRVGRSFSLVLLDLDGLKKVNDAYGHTVGSRALCRVANVLQTQCRSIDVTARYGGDEFAIILPETQLQSAKNVAGRIVEFVQNDLEKPRISVSFGLATCPEDGDSLKKILQIADVGLYLMKGHGSYGAHLIGEIAN